MKALIILALGSLISFGAQASQAQVSQDRDQTDRALRLAKRANGYLRSTINENEVSSNRNGDLFGNYGFSRCPIEKAVVKFEGANFTVTTPCGERYQVVVTGKLEGEDDSITSAKVELR